MSDAVSACDFGAKSSQFEKGEKLVKLNFVVHGFFDTIDHNGTMISKLPSRNNQR